MRNLKITLLLDLLTTFATSTKKKGLRPFFLQLCFVELSIHGMLHAMNSNLGMWYATHTPIRI